MTLLTLLKVEAYDHIQKNPTLGYILSIFEPALPHVVPKHRIPWTERLCQLYSTSRLNYTYSAFCIQLYVSKLNTVSVKTNCCLPVSVWGCEPCHGRENPNVIARINGGKISIGPRNKRVRKRAQEKWEKKIKRTDEFEKLCNMEKREEGDEWWKGGLINDTGKNTGEMDKEYTKDTAERRKGMREIL